MNKLASILIMAFTALQLQAANHTVKNISEFNLILNSVQPGDTITLANGIWENTELVFSATGTKENPIVLTAETPGKVIFQGQSSLVLNGSFLEVYDLTFKAGYSPIGAVISFAPNSKNPSNNCRVSRCVITDFSKPERFDKDNWVAIFGKNNRFDHNYLAGKLNAGVTLAVYLNSKLSQDNHNRIDHNYFGERPRLGSNGGETMRVGTSTYSLVPANTIVEDNYFERCNGEVEALSIKATSVIIRRNAFFETEGCLALRHGNDNQVYENIFIGNGKPATAGLRVINAGHDIHDNYFFRLTGERFRAALAVMNGVPNSAINRYHQVKDAKIYKNTFVDCSNIEFGTGSDAERTATPIDTRFTENTIYSAGCQKPLKLIDAVDGITFKDNMLFTEHADFEMDGFQSSSLKMVRDKAGFYFPVKKKSKKIDPVGTISSDVLVQKKEAGPSWFNTNSTQAMAKADVFEVKNTPGALVKAIQSAKAGDTIILISEGTYMLSEPLEIDKLTYLKAGSNLEKRPLIQYNDDRARRKSHILLKNGGNLWLQGIAFNGTTDLGNKTAYAIATDDQGMNKPYWLDVTDCEFYNFNESKYNAFKATKGSYASTITFDGCLFHTISGDAISISAEKEDRGIYNAEFVTLKNCTFYKVMGSALDLYRGGNDESTLGPFLTVDNCLFENVNNKELGSVLRLIGVQEATVSNSIFSNSGQGGRTVKFEETRWNNCIVTNCNLHNAGRIESFYNNVVQGKITDIKPKYINEKEHDFRLSNAAEFPANITIGR